MLDRYLKGYLDHTRQKAIWYMRKDMVEDCSGQGGCCSRSCGCCSHRQLSEREKGRGHCTTECWCCTNWRGFEPPDEEKDNRWGGLITKLRSENKSYLLRLTKSFFIHPSSRSFQSHKKLQSPQNFQRVKRLHTQSLGGGRCLERTLLMRKIDQNKLLCFAT